MSLDISRKTPESVSHAIVSGTAFNGTDAVPVIAQAPGYLPSPWGSDQMVSERLVLDNQDYANMIAGRIIANANREIVDVNVPLAGNWLPALDIAPQNWVQMNVQAADNKRGVSLEGYYHLRNITSEINVKGGVSVADITLVPEAFGPDGVPGPYPDDWPWPTFPLPDFPEFPPWTFPRWDTLMVRNCWKDRVPYTPYQGTVINDPSSILPANDGDEVTNLLAYSEAYSYPVEFVSDGISIFFHQYDSGYERRIYRHDIATGAADYIEFPDDGGNSYFEELTCIDVGIVAVLAWSYTGVAYDETIIVYKIDFNLGTASEVYRYVNADIGWINYFLTAQSEVNVYTVFGTMMNPLGSDYYALTHRYNWTTGVSDVVVTWVNTAGGGYGIEDTPPIIAGYEIYSWLVIPGGDPRGRGYICYYNFVTGEFGSTLIFHAGVTNRVEFYLTGYYRDLERIYFIARETYPYTYYLAYVSTLTKEVSYTDIPIDNTSFHEVHKLIGNKHKCWRQDWYDKPAVRYIDPSNGELKLTSSDSLIDQFPLQIKPQPRIWAAQVDDIDERIWSFQGHYIIGEGADDVIIAETGITPPSGAEVYPYLYVLGRTFIVYFYDWDTRYKTLYAVHYPGSLVI